MKNFYDTLSVSDFAASCEDMYYIEFMEHCEKVCRWVEKEISDPQSPHRHNRPRLSLLKGFVEEAMDFVRTDGRSYSRTLNQDHYATHCQILRALYRKAGKTCPL